MTKNQSPIKALLVGIISILALASLPVNAQDNNRGLIVSPAIFELSADRGGSYQFSLNVENNSENEDYSLSPLAQTFTADNEEGNPTVSAIPDGSPLRNWISFEESKYEIKKGQKAESKFTVNVPSETDPGSYYFAISYTTKLPATNEGAKVVLNKEVSALLFVTVKGQITRNVSFDSFTSYSQFVDPFFDGLNLNYKIKLDGNAYLKPSGNVFAGNNLESPDSTLTLNPNQKIILPNTGRNFTMQTNPTLDWGFLSFKPSSLPNKGEILKVSDVKVPWFGSQKFTAQVLYVNNDGSLDKKSAELQVFFFPWKTLLLVLSAIGLIAAGYYGYWYLARTKKM
jgi:hypothetical protein